MKKRTEAIKSLLAAFYLICVGVAWSQENVKTVSIHAVNAYSKQEWRVRMYALVKVAHEIYDGNKAFRRMPVVPMWGDTGVIHITHIIGPLRDDSHDSWYWVVVREGGMAGRLECSDDVLNIACMAIKKFIKETKRPWPIRVTVTGSYVLKDWPKIRNPIYCMIANDYLMGAKCPK